MKRTFFLLTLFAAIFGAACGPAKPTSNAVTNSNSNANAESTAAKTPDDGLYQGKGKVTKINNELGSVEIDHENIPDLMPAMKMEFSVKNKALLKPIAVGDAVNFTIEYKQGTEIIVAIGK